MAEPLDEIRRLRLQRDQADDAANARLREIRRLRLLLAELAAVPPVTDTACGPACCLYCDQDAPTDGWEQAGWHAAACPWRRATEVR